jgi:hypothetical protein
MNIYKILIAEIQAVVGRRAGPAEFQDLAMRLPEPAA